MKPDHVEMMESGGHVCKHCGGAVDADGYSAGGDVESEETRILDDNNDESDETAQLDSTERLRRASGFADAISRRGR